MVETVKRHKMQRVAGLVQSAHMDEIHQQAKFGQEVWVTKQAKTVKLKKNWTNYLKLLFCHWITLSLAVTLKKLFPLFAANHADLSFISLNTTFRWF